MMPIQQMAPRMRAFDPVLMSLARSVLMPMAAMAMIIKNLLMALKGAKTCGSIPA